MYLLIFLILFCSPYLWFHVPAYFSHPFSFCYFYYFALNSYYFYFICSFELLLIYPVFCSCYLVFYSLSIVTCDKCRKYTQLHNHFAHRCYFCPMYLKGIRKQECCQLLQLTFLLCFISPLKSSPS